MAHSDVHPTHRFQKWQVWPGSYDNPLPDGNYPFPGEPSRLFSRTTPVASMGSCFAREIKRVLIERGYRYLTEEAWHPASKHASAAWERTYNLFSMRQIFEYTFGDWKPQLRWWLAPRSGKAQDPYRRIIVYDSQAAAEEDFERHRQCSLKALTTAEVLFLTLGLTELWEDREDGSVICLPSGPYVTEGGDMSRYRFRVSRYAENYRQLERIYALMKAHNPSCTIVVTVSPVHLWATFREDSDVISASCNSKSTLRALVDEFVASHQGMLYFPSYEMATIYGPLMGHLPFSEGREPFHVNAAMVEYIMEQFLDHYGEKGG
ncbi:MAG: GSCFA domain-containing protein [Candidatus Eremiobacteraeota bacterium]|nr:GSCFA domain-containing protein [Candidatus Eremiobacteraeota bacterium]